MNYKILLIITLTTIILLSLIFNKTEAEITSQKFKKINKHIHSITSKKYEQLSKEYKELSEFQKKNLETKFLIKLDLLSKNDLIENLDTYTNLHALFPNNKDYKIKTNHYKYLSMEKRNCTKLSKKDENFIKDTIKMYTIDKILTDDYSYEFFNLGKIFESSQKVIDMNKYYFSTSFLIRGNSDLTYSKNIGGNIYLDKLCRPIKLEYYLENIKSIDIQYFDK